MEERRREFTDILVRLENVTTTLEKSVAPQILTMQKTLETACEKINSIEKKVEFTSSELNYLKGRVNHHHTTHWKWYVYLGAGVTTALAIINAVISHAKR